MEICHFIQRKKNGQQLNSSTHHHRIIRASLSWKTQKLWTQLQHRSKEAVLIDFRHSDYYHRKQHVTEVGYL